MKTYLLILHGPLDRSPSGAEKLMSALSKRLPLSPEALQSLFSKLPAIVRKDTDRASSELFASVLRSLGAVVEISETDAELQPASENQVEPSDKNSQIPSGSNPVTEKSGRSIEELMALLDSDSPDEIEVLESESEDILTVETHDDEPLEFSLSGAEDIPASISEATLTQSDAQAAVGTTLLSELSFESESPDETTTPSNLDWELPKQQTPVVGPEIAAVREPGIQSTPSAVASTFESHPLETNERPNPEGRVNSVTMVREEDLPQANTTFEQTPAENAELIEHPPIEPLAELAMAETLANSAGSFSNWSRYRSAIAGTAILVVIAIVGFFNPFETKRAPVSGANLISKEAIDKFLDQYSLDLKAAKKHANTPAASTTPTSTGISWRQQKQQELLAVTADFLTTTDKRGYFSLVLEGSAPPRLSPEQIARGELPGAWLRHFEVRNLKVEQDPAKPSGPEDPVFYFTANGPSHVYLEDQKGSGRMLVPISVSGSIDFAKSLISAHWEISRNALSTNRINATERLKDGSFALRYVGDLELAPLENASAPDMGAKTAATTTQPAVAAPESKPVAINTK